MKSKVILISIDGMRPDGVLACGNPFAAELMKRGAYTFDARTVFPSATLPCHMSMFHSVPPERHGITTNHYMPPVRPVQGLFEQIHAFGGRCGMFYGWEPLRDIGRPRNLVTAEYLSLNAAEGTDAMMTDRLFRCLEDTPLDFVFLYLGETDEKGGHDNGFMSEAYLGYISRAMDCVKRVMERLGSEYTVIVTADHGGHDRTHGTESPEDMTIPMFFTGPDFTPGEERHGVSILDLAPTVTAALGLPPAPDWEGRSLI